MRAPLRHPLSFTFALLALAGAACSGSGSSDKKAAATVIDFESVTLPATGYEDAEAVKPATAIVVGGVSFACTYDASYDYSSGAAISSLTDTTTAGYTNPYSAFPGKGAGGSAQFAVVYPSGTGPAVDFGADVAVKSVAVANTTYAALSMRDGDRFAKKFTAADQDFFAVIIEGFDGSGSSTGKVRHYLADLRTAASPGIQTDWQVVDLTGLGKVRGLGISFESSDVGSYGINTPKYVLLDDLTFVP